MTSSSPAEPAAPEEWPGPPAYLPLPEPQRRPDGARLYAGVAYAMPIGYRPLKLDVWVPDVDAPPLVVWIHGGAFMIGDRRTLPETLRVDQLFEELLAAGLAVATVDYRLSLEASFPAQLHDLKAAVRYLRAHAGVLGVDPDRVGVWGESAGGHLAALVGLTGRDPALGDDPALEGDLGVTGVSSEVAAVVDWYGPADFDVQPDVAPPPALADRLPGRARSLSPEALLLLDTDEALRAAANPVNHVSAEAPPFLLVHGTADRVVPFVHSEILAARLEAVGVPHRLVPVDGADHIFAGCADVDAVVGLSVAYLADTLTSAKGRP
jgi:acetyl esterase/lipase